MPKYEKYVNALFLLGGAVVWLVSQHYLGVVFGYFQLGRKLGPATEWIQILLPLLLAFLTFALLRSNRKSHSFTEESVVELTKVSWPTSKEVRFGTLIVIIAVVMAGICLGLLDIGLNSVVRTLIGA